MLEVNANTVIINDETIAVSKKPKWKRGSPKAVTHSAMAGDKVVVSHALDYSEAMGEATIMLRNTLENIEIARDWQKNVGKNGIRFVDSNTGFTITFNQQSVTDDFEVDHESEEFEVKFMGDQGV